MTMHRAHPIEGDPPEAILYDDCERCVEHARDLVSLDDHNLLALVARVVATDGTGYSRTDAERMAMIKLHNVVVLGQRLARLGVFD